ncbi:MAG: sulfite exporter TauE/SafE family protein [Flavobacteriales bacterium]|nr:MAG: sulfite exporter TauE/SafE family protein [Flavobacteriales bacterium]
MDASHLLIPAVALAASLVTLISGFGLGTLLLPVFALFFPLEVAIGLTAVVHLLNNLFKLGLLWKDIHWSTVLRFGVPGIVGAYLGARLMLLLGARDALYQGLVHPVDPLDLVIAGLMLVFGLFELSKTLNTLSLPPRWMVPGGLISGFFGGLSGHQGALRSLFLLRSGLAKEAFIASGVAIACLVDLTRLPAYATKDLEAVAQEQGLLLLASTLAAFLGAWWGKKLIPKVTMRGVQLTVGVLILAISVMLATGII